MKKEYILVVDIGNSYIKVGLFEYDNDNSIEIIMFKTNLNLDETFLNENLKKIEQYNIKHSVLGSVVPKINNVFIEYIENKFNIKPYQINFESKFSFDLTDSVRKQVGDDLLALSEFCVAKGHSVLGFSFGTAISSVFIYNKFLEGVFISPGISFGLNHLINNACLLDKTELNKNSTLSYGNTTNKALEAGINNLRRGIVMSSIELVKTEYKLKNIPCLISGGEASKIDPVNFDYEINKEAILIGYKKIYLLNN